MRVYRFGLFQVEPDGKLLRQGEPVKLQEQPLRVLCALLERPGEIVTRDELRQALWPEGTNVEFDGSLNAVLKRLRSALGDDADNPIFIQTVARRGYRFIAPVASDPVSEIGRDLLESDALESPGLATNGDQRSAHSRLHSWQWRLTPATAVVLLFLLLFGGWWYSRRRRPSPAAPRKVIAILPFSNEGAGPDFDYLRYAIANDLATDLTYAHSVSVRPFASTTRDASESVDPGSVGRELRVTHVVAGGFLFDHQNLRVNLELVDVAHNQVVWREEVTASPKELVALHDKLAVRTAKGLLPSMNVAGPSSGDIPAPQNEQALELFLHSLSIPLDPLRNQLAIKKLEESVALDSGYAPAWGELGWRYYVDYHYAHGGEAAKSKALEAYRRQSELDSNAPSLPTSMRVEQGDLNGAYDQAAQLLRRRPDLSTAHFWMSYVLRYAGLLDEAGKECDAALALDPGFNLFRTCALPFIMTGDYAHAQRYISLDESSGFGALMRLRIALRQRDAAAVLADVSSVTQSGYEKPGDPRPWAFLRACLNHAPEADLGKAAAMLEADPNMARDGELLYQNAETLSFCGQTEPALRELARAIRANYCSYPAMDKNPLYDPIRTRPEFAEWRQAAIQCQLSFLAHRRQVDATLPASRF